MCDNLGISDTKVEAFHLTYMGQTVVYTNEHELFDMIRDEIIQNLDVGEEVDFQVKKVLMTESQIEALPEFDGF